VRESGYQKGIVFFYPRSMHVTCNSSTPLGRNVSSLWFIFLQILSLKYIPQQKLSIIFCHYY
jgi:hypothetical protein